MKIINVLILLFDLIYFVKSNTCNENWVLIEEKCVKFSSGKLTYHEAVEHCSNAGMYNIFILFFHDVEKFGLNFLFLSHPLNNEILNWKVDLRIFSLVKKKTAVRKSSFLVISYL